MPAAHQGRTAVYRLYDPTGRLLYVGITSNTALRFARHAAVKPWWGDVARRDIQWIATRAEALIAERVAIFAEHPVWNVNSGDRGHEMHLHGPGAVQLSAHTAEARQRFLEAQAVLAAAREDLEDSLVEEMKRGAPPNRLAKMMPWSTETLRMIARQAGVPLQRQPTVKSIKPRKRTAKRVED